jgi:hypothetical protein
LEKNEKTVVIVHRESGFKALQYMWQTVAKEYAESSDGGVCAKACWMSMWDPTDKYKLKRFNCDANKDGSQIRVAFVDAQTFEVGTDFNGVRRLIMVDVPKSWASWMQRMGRVLRFCGHNNLPESERNVRIDMFVATRAGGRETSDQYYVKKLKAKNIEMVKALEYLRDNAAADRGVLKVFDPAVAVSTTMEGFGRIRKSLPAYPRLLNSLAPQL